VRARLVAVLVLTALSLPGAAAAAGQRDSLEITLDRPRISTGLGEVLTVESRIVNHTGSPSERMIAHVNVVSTDGTYVDLEDWSSTVTQPVEPLAPNADATLSWELQAVNAGDFQVYVVLLPDSGALVASPSTRVRVAERRTLNAGGALPVAILVPLLLGLGVLAVRLRVRRRAG
jgi:hypothetical protein